MERGCQAIVPYCTWRRILEIAKNSSILTLLHYYSLKIPAASICALIVHQELFNWLCNCGPEYLVMQLYDASTHGHSTALLLNKQLPSLKGCILEEDVTPRSNYSVAAMRCAADGAVLVDFCEVHLGMRTSG